MQASTLRLSVIGVLAATAASLLGCASTAHEGAGAQQTAALPGKPGCFWLRNFDGSWTVLNDRQLIVYAPLYSHPYLIQLFEPIPNLKFDQRLGFLDTERTGMICDDKQDDLLVPNWTPHRVPIVAVRELTTSQARQLLADNHIQLPGNGKPGKGNQDSGRVATSQ
jgi:hypothetical protein